jgi:hypothetical protein
MSEQHELLPFLAIWAVQFQKDRNLDGLHPTHYDLMVKYGARMDSFKRATNAMHLASRSTLTRVSGLGAGPQGLHQG